MCSNSNERVLKRTSGHPGPGGGLGAGSVSGVTADLQKINILPWKCSSTHKIDRDGGAPVAATTQGRPCPPWSPTRTLQAPPPNLPRHPPHTPNTQQRRPRVVDVLAAPEPPRFSSKHLLSACLNLRRGPVRAIGRHLACDTEAAAACRDGSFAAGPHLSANGSPPGRRGPQFLPPELVF